MTISDAEFRRRTFQSWKWDHAALLDKRDEVRRVLTEYVNDLRASDALYPSLDAGDVAPAVERIMSSIDNSCAVSLREDVLDWFLS